MDTQIAVLKSSRNIILQKIKGLSLEQLHKIPDGFNNNIAWNVAHLVVTQQLLHYRLSGLDCLVPDELIDNYRKGTFPTEVFTQEKWEETLELFIGLPDTLQEDLEENIFSNYTPYTTSMGFNLTNIKEAIAFNNLHEGIHLGTILALLKLV